LEDAILDKLERLDAGPFLIQSVREGRHGAWRDAPDVRMVASASHIEDRLAMLEHLVNGWTTAQVRTARPSRTES